MIVRLTAELTTTPLAKRHQRDVAASALGGRRRIAYGSFDRSKYPAAALSLACDAQRSLAIGEYMAVDLFAKLAAALSVAGVPIDIVSAESRIPADEIRHTDLALQMARALGDRDEPLEVDTERYRYLGERLSMQDLDIAMLEMHALGESLACSLLASSRERATDPVVKAHYTALLRDEIHHARLGWHYLAWRAPQWSHEERQRVADFAGEFIVSTEQIFVRGRDAPRGAVRAARALGVLDTKAQHTAIRTVMVDEIVPGLDGLGLGASHAWRARRRVWS